MTPEQALQTLEIVTGIAQINRQDQQNVTAALAVLRDLITKREKKGKE